MITIPNRFADLPEFPDQFVVGCHRGSLGALRTRIDSDHPYPLGGELKTLDRIQSIEWNSMLISKIKNFTRYHAAVDDSYDWKLFLLCAGSANPLPRSICFRLSALSSGSYVNPSAASSRTTSIASSLPLFHIIQSSGFWFVRMCSSISHFTSHPRTWDARIRILKR